MNSAHPRRTLTELLGRRVPAALLFDLDGTLLDSLPDLATAGAQRVRGWIGDGARQLVREALLFAQTGIAQSEFAPPVTLDYALLERALGIYMRYYAACCTERSELFAGVRECLAHWRKRGALLACVTNKSARFTEPLLEHFGLRTWLSIAVSGDSLPQRKPAAAPLLFACEQLGVLPRDALMVGDSRNDVLAARAAGMPVVCVSYGYNHGRSIEAERPDAIVDSLLELI